ncbi:MAG: hypothetical protein JO366_17730 [Methylobacteriaceae bacterium]|nr:hypothetical protein [Methylobacteriaceae bacterium]
MSRRFITTLMSAILAAATAAAAVPALGFVYKPFGCTQKVCVRWARGAPGTFAGPCVAYKYVHYLRCPAPPVIH